MSPTTSSNDLLAAFEANPQDHRAFDALVSHLVAEDDREALQSVFDRLPDWADSAMSPLLRVLSQHARAHEENDLGSFLHFWTGMVLWREFQDPQKAEMSFRKVTRTPPDPEALRAFYLEFFTAQKNWRRLEQFLLDPTKGGLSDEVEVKRMLGRLSQEHDLPDRAVGFWQAVFDADPSDEEAEEALNRLYAATGKWHAMVDLLKARLEKTPEADVEGRIALHKRMMALYRDRMNAPTRVVGEWQAILEIDPGNAEAQDALAREFEAMNRWPDLVKLLERRIEHVPSTAGKIALHERISAIMLEKFSNMAEAIRHHQAILDLDPENRKAIEVLKDVYDKRRDYDSFVQVSEREIALLSDDDERQRAWIDLARLATERIRRPETPIALWERVREREPDHPEALTHLEQLYEREKDHERLATILERRAAGLEGRPSEKAALSTLLEKLGLVYATKLEDQDRAAGVWRRILALDPEHRKAQAELRKKYLDERDWESLEWFFRQYGTLHEWVRTLETQAKAVPDDGERVELLFKAARLWQEELGDVRRAVKNLESILEIRPDHEETARLLVPVYKELLQWKKLPPVYETVLAHTTGTEAREDLLLEMAEVQERQLRDPDAAFFHYVQAVRENPSSTRLYPELGRLAEASRSWETYVTVLGEAIEVLSDEKVKVRALLDCGIVYRDRLGDREAALASFNRVIEIDEESRDALDAIEELYRTTGAWDQLIGVYDRKLRIARDADERKEILFRLARTWTENLENADEAEAIYREMLGDFPDDVRVHDALSAIYLASGRHADLADVIGRKRDVVAGTGAPGPVLADLECQLGMLAYGTHPGRKGVEAAVDHYEEALRHDPVHDESVRCLEELVADEGQQLRIARLLEPVYEARGDRALLAESLELQVLHAAAEEDWPGQVRLLERLAGLYSGELRNPDLAWRTWGRLFALEPDREDVRQAFERLTGDLDLWPRLVEVYGAVADEPSDPRTRLAIKLTVARTENLRLHDLPRAKDHYHQVLEEEPNHAEALDALEAIYAQLDLAEDLLEIYRRKVDLAVSAPEKIDYLFRQCDLLRDRLERLDDAVLAAREAFDLDPRSVAALQRLDELFTRQGEWKELAGVLQETLERTADDPARQAAILLRLAGVHEARLEDVETAISLYARVLELSPDDPAGVAALERLFEDPAHAASIAPLLEPVYERARDWERLVDVYLAREGAAEYPEEKVDWQVKVARLFEEDGDRPDLAFEHYVLAARLLPGRERTLSELLRLADVLDNHGELVLHLQGIVGEIDDDLRRLETHRVIARLAEEKTRDLQGAEKQHRAILEIDPNDVAAIDALVALYRKTGDTARLVDTLLAKAPMVQDAAERRSVYAEAGELAATRLDDAKRAIEIYETLHRLESTEGAAGPALDALEGLYAKVGSWAELVDVYRQKIERATDLETRKSLAAAMGRVQAEEQENLDDAVHTWRTLLEWDPSDLRALDRLDDLYSRAEDWYSLQGVLEKKRGLFDGMDAEGWAESTFRLGRLLEAEDRLANVPEAIRVYAELLRRRPEHEGATERLAHVVAERDEREDAFRVLRPVLEARGAYDDLWSLYETVAGFEVEGNPQKAIATLHEMADLAERAAAAFSDAPRRAFGALSRAFSVDPRHGATAERIEAIADRHALVTDLVSLYEETAKESGDDLLALDLRLKSGALLMERLGEPDRAIRVYESVREDHPSHPEVLSRLHRLYEERGRWSDLAAILRDEVEAAADPRDRLPFLATLARVAEEKLHDVDRAYEAWIEVLDFDRQSEEATSELWRLFTGGHQRLAIAERLEPIYTERGAWDELHALLETKLDAVPDATDRLEIMRQLALLNLDRLHRVPEAIVWYGRAFRLDPEDEFLRERLTELATQAERWEDLLAFLMDGAAASEEDERRVELWHRAAEVARDRLRRDAESERIYRRILDVDEKNEKALQALASMLEAGSRWEDLEPILSRLAAVTDFDDERIRLLMRLASLYQDRLARREDAAKSYAKVLEHDEMHRPAMEALEVLYREDGDLGSLYGVLQRLADTARDDAERVRRLSDMAVIAESHLDDAARATEIYEEILGLVPADLHALHELERLLEASESWDGLVDAYERELRLEVADAPRRLDLYKRLGRILQTKLDDAFRAQSYWEKAWQEAPDDREAMEALRVAYREAYQLEGLCRVLGALLRAEPQDDAARLEMWRELGEIRTEQLPDPEEAIRAWREVLRLAPGDTRAMEGLERLYAEGERWADMVDLMRLRLAATADAEAKAELWLQIGQVQEDRLRDPDLAGTTYRELLEADPANLEASRRLEKIHEAREDWQALADVLVARTDHLPDPQDQLLHLQRLAKVFEGRLGDRESAFLVLQKGNELVPDDFGTLEELGRLAEATGLWEDLLGVYEHTLKHLEGDATLEILLKAAALVRERLRDAAGAVGWYERVLEVDAESEVALRALVDLHSELERWEPLVVSLRRLSEVAPDYAERIRLLERAAGVLEDRLGSKEDAIAAWYAVLDQDEMNRGALENLERLHTETRQWEALCKVLGRMAETDPSRAVGLHLRAADVLEHELGKVDEAVQRYEDVLTFEPANRTALDHLEVIHGEREDWPKLVETYERAHDASTTDEERIEVSRKIALLQKEVFGEREAASEWYRRILVLAPGDEDAVRALEALYREGESWEDLVQHYESQCQIAADAETRAQWLVRVAHVYRDDMGEPDMAIGAFERVAQAVPGHAEALAELEKLYAAELRWESVVDVLERKLAHETNPAARIELMNRQGAIARDEIGDPISAARHFDRALDEAPGHEPSIQALIDIHTSEERWDLVVETLERKLAALADSRERCRVHIELARIWKEHLYNEEKPLEHLEHAVEADPENEEALRPLAEHYMETGAWAKAMPLLDLLADRMSRVGDAAARADVHRRLAKCAEALLDDDRALDEYRQAEALAPGDPDVLRGLGNLYYKREKWAEAEKHLLSLLEALGGEITEEDFVGIHLLLGESAFHAGDVEQAKVYLSEVVDTRSDDPAALRRIAQVYEAHGDWKEAIAYKEQLLDLLMDPLERFQVQMSVGDLYWEKLHDVRGAADAYEQASMMEGHSKVPILQLIQLHAREKDFEEAIRWLDHLVAAEDDPRKKAQYAMSVAVMYRDELKDVAGAVESFGRVLDFDLSRLDAFRSIDELLTREKDWKALEQNYRMMIQRVQDAGSGLEKKGALLFSLYKNLGEIYRSRLKDLDYAVSAFELAQAERPQNLVVREILAGLYEANEGYLDRAVEAHRWLIRSQPDRWDSYHRLFQVFRKMGDPDRAWTLAGLLLALEKANEEEAGYYRQHLDAALPDHSRSLDQDAWRKFVASEFEDEALGQIFQLLQQSLDKKLDVKTLKDLGFKKKDRLDLSQPTLLASTLKTASRVLGIPVPDVYHDPKRMGVEVLPVREPAIVVGADMMSGQSEKTLGFDLAKRLVYCHPFRRLAALFDHDALDIMFMAAAHACDPGFQLQLHPDMPEEQKQAIARQVGEISAEIQAEITPQARRELKQVMADFWARNAAPRIGIWHRAVELTANHAALHLTGDPEHAGRTISKEVSGLSKLSRGDKLRDLVHFVLSDRYAELRKSTGVTIDVSDMVA